MTDYSDMESPKQRRERIASTVIWSVGSLIACGASFHIVMWWFS